MCLHAFLLDEEMPTKEERLMSAAKVRQHHLDLATAANYDQAGVDAFRAHLLLHREAADRLRAARTK